MKKDIIRKKSLFFFFFSFEEKKKNIDTEVAANCYKRVIFRVKEIL